MSGPSAPQLPSHLSASGKYQISIWWRDNNIKNIWIQFQLVLNAYPLSFHWQKRMVIHVGLKGCPESIGQRSLHPAKIGIVIQITHSGLQIGSMWMSMKTNLNMDPSIQGFLLQCRGLVRTESGCVQTSLEFSSWKLTYKNHQVSKDSVCN